MMNSEINPLGTCSPSSVAGNPVNKTMHPQGTTASYGEPSHMPQSLHNIFPPVSQALSAPLSLQPSVPVAKTENLKSQLVDKPQSNGTSEVKPPQKNEDTSSFLFSPQDKSIQPAPVPQLSQVQEKYPENTTTFPIEIPQLKSSELITAKTQTSVSSTVTNIKPFLTSCPDTQSTESFEATTSTSSGALTCLENNEELVSPNDDLSVNEPERKKLKTEEDIAPTEQPENLKINKSIRADKDEKDESSDPPQTTELNVIDEEKVNQKEKQVPVAQTDNSPIRSPTRRTKSQTRKQDGIPKTPKEPKTPVQKSPSGGKAKRQRIRTQHYQSPLPEVELVSKISSQTSRSNDEKLIVFYKNEFLAVRNAEGSFYLCQAVQNIYKSSSKIKIRWLSQDKNDKTGEIYIPDFYDLTDFDCILTNLSLNKVDKKIFKLPPSEKERTQSILNRSLAAEKGEVTSSSLSEEHPDGLDLSLYRDEDQLKKRKARKRKSNFANSGKEIVTKKSPEPSEVRKVSSSAKIGRRKAAVETTKLLKKSTPQPEVTKSVSRLNRISGRSKGKGESKTSRIFDQKKAKVLAKIGKKTTKPEAKSVQRDSKNAKSGTKTVASSKKSSQTKTTVKPRSLRRSTRK